jgi:hypothetical protein
MRDKASVSNSCNLDTSSSFSCLRGGTVVHEASHFTKTGGTDDHAYCKAALKSLGQNKPGLAVKNADSYLYFALVLIKPMLYPNLYIYNVKLMYPCPIPDKLVHMTTFALVTTSKKIIPPQSRASYPDGIFSIHLAPFSLGYLLVLLCVGVVTFSYWPTGRTL